MPNAPTKAPPRDAADAAQLGVELLAMLQKDLAVHRPTEVGRELLAMLQQDFGVEKRSVEAAQRAEFGQALLTKIARDFGSPPSEPALATARGTSALSAQRSRDVEAAERELARISEAPLADDEADDLDAIRGGGPLDFLRRLLFRHR